MKTLYFLSFALISLNALAANSDFSLDTYCRTAYGNRYLSQAAIKNEGKIIIESAYDQNTKEEYYRGCRYDTPWISAMYESICNDNQVRSTEEIKKVAKDLKAPNYILFFFDGAADFNAQYAFDNVKPVNIDGSEGMDLSMGHANGIRPFVQMMNSSEHELSKHKKDIEFHYHSGSGFKQRENYTAATACAQESKYYLDVLNSLDGREKTETKWLVAGYSNGGALSIDFQNYLPKLDIKPELVFTIDPIAQAAKYVFYKLKKTIGKKNNNTKRLVNLYQQTDVDSISLLKLRGKTVEQADVNFMLTPENSYELSSEGSANHVRVVGTHIVSEIFNCELGKIFDSPESCKAADKILKKN